ncbi:MAG: DUF6569 family protein, partial [Rhodospirillales bacterium]
TPLTLQEAMERKLIRVHETGDVNSLKVENLGDKDIFIQAGDIVKGGKQDRVLSLDMVLAPKSGRIDIAAFCVEHGRWSGRGGEKTDAFGSSNNALPAKLRASTVAKAGEPPRAPGAPQQKVWAGVQEMQRKLADNVGQSVNAKPSPTSMQLTLENDKLKSNVAAYEKAFADILSKTPDAVGFVAVINGKISSAELYNSTALFQRMWPKLLNAAAVEAISEQDKKPVTPIANDTVTAFLDQLGKAPATTQKLSPNTSLRTQETDRGIASDTVLSDGAVIHRSYLAK